LKNIKFQNLRSNGINTFEGKVICGRNSVEKNYNFSGNYLGVNTISKHSDGQHNVMKKNNTGVSVRNLSPFRAGFKLIEIRKFIMYKNVSLKLY